MRMTRNHVPSGAPVRIRLVSSLLFLFFFIFPKLCSPARVALFPLIRHFYLFDISCLISLVVMFNNCQAKAWLKLDNWGRCKHDFGLTLDLEDTAQRFVKLSISTCISFLGKIRGIVKRCIR
ncbi:hypothetical protein V8C44DRAFT_314326 [Trichoderma aethiopicum]